MYTIKSIKTRHTATLPTWPFVTCYIIWNIVGLQSNSNIMMNMEDSIYTCLRPCQKTTTMKTIQKLEHRSNKLGHEDHFYLTGDGIYQVYGGIWGKYTSIQVLWFTRYKGGVYSYSCFQSTQGMKDELYVRLYKEVCIGISVSKKSVSRVEW